MEFKIKEQFAKKCPCWSKNLFQMSLAPNDPRADASFQAYYSGHPTLILHSYGYPNPSAKNQVTRWDKESNDNAIAHFTISSLCDRPPAKDDDEHQVHQALRLEMMGWHAGPQGNPLFIGAEMSESDAITYTGGDKFIVNNRARALEQCETAYNNAVALFAELCVKLHIDPLGTRVINGKVFPNVMGHCEWNRIRGVYGHTDPEHYWSGLGTSHTMDGFRRDVKKKMEDVIDMTREEVTAIVKDEVQAVLGPALSRLSKVTTESIDTAVQTIVDNVNDRIESIVTEHTGRKAADIDNVMSSIRPRIQKLLDAGVINGGTPSEVNPNDVNFYGEDLRVLAVMTAYIDKKMKELENKILFRAE